MKNFVGREGELEKISSEFRDETERPRILVLHALGGQGKSQIALEYCHRSRTTYQGIFWINSTSQSTMIQSLVSIAQELDNSAIKALEQDEAKVNLALRTLEHWHHRWLMVFDNCDDPATFSDVERFIPQGTRQLNLRDMKLTS